MSYRILLVDDETDILEFVGYNLRKEGYEVFTASDGETALQIAAQTHPHLILLDVMMPRKDGFQTCKQLRADPATSDAVIVFLSARGEDESLIEGFDSGADDYISKPIKMNVLMTRIKAILKRIDPMLPDSSAEHTVTVDRERYLVTKNGESIVLPRKEFSLLCLLLSKPGKLFTREEIYDKVWGSDVVVGERTIDVHVRNLRKRIGERHVVTVKGVGYKYED